MSATTGSQHGGFPGTCSIMAAVMEPLGVAGDECRGSSTCMACTGAAQALLLLPPVHSPPAAGSPFAPAPASLSWPVLARFRASSRSACPACCSSQHENAVGGPFDAHQDMQIVGCGQGMSWELRTEHRFMLTSSARGLQCRMAHVGVLDLRSQSVSLRCSLV